jgi:hypothetical protein
MRKRIAKSKESCWIVRSASTLRLRPLQRLLGHRKVRSAKERLAVADDALGDQSFAVGIDGGHLFDGGADGLGLSVNVLQAIGANCIRRRRSR